MSSTAGTAKVLHPCPSIYREDSFGLVASLNQIASHDTNAVAAHLSDRAILVAVIHEPFAITLGDADKAITADSCRAIADSSHLLRGNFVRPFWIKEQHKVIVRSMPICCDHEVRIAFSMVARRSESGSSQVIRWSLRNQVSCLRIYCRVASFV